MNRSFRFAVWVLVVVLAVVATGCKKKPPQAPEQVMESAPATPEPVEVKDEPAMPPPVDETPDLMSLELQELNERILREGLIGHVYFDFDRYELKPEARERLAKNAEFMKGHPGLIFRIEGHCDERGTNEYNIALGDRRANAARDYLMSLGVEGIQLQTVSYGEERPFCTSSHDESCWWQNRRAHFLAIEKRG
ncbi:MAG: peptidoglycan-associated lipoprotein Pal [Thermoanaerobaculia bacterium]|nr:peptidoglycan-associated lipoprotein Pal [Thermoanaerobaculia bacterium]